MDDRKMLSGVLGLENFEHKRIFNESEFPWEALERLKSYIDDLIADRADKRIIGEGTEIDASAKIEGSVIIGKNSKIADNVLIREGCIIGDNVNIGHAVELKHSIILSNSSVAHLNYIGDSIIGNSVNIGGGAIIANWRFDKKSVKVKIRNEKIDTGMEKFGAIVGDNSGIGANAVLNPGTVLGKNTIVYPLVSVRGTHPDGSVIK